jgi:hypothetical protein
MEEARAAPHRVGALPGVRGAHARSAPLGPGGSAAE